MRSMLTRQVVLAAILSTAGVLAAQTGAIAAPLTVAQAGSAGAQPYNPPPTARSSNRDQPPSKWHVGDSLPTEFRDAQFRVDNLTLHNLPKPKRGTRWVGVGGEYLLVDGRQKIVEVRQ
jgi:Ni/Co efflux regulator RcnB